MERRHRRGAYRPWFRIRTWLPGRGTRVGTQWPTARAQPAEPCNPLAHYCQRRRAVRVSCRGRGQPNGHLHDVPAIAQRRSQHAHHCAAVFTETGRALGVQCRSRCVGPRPRCARRRNQRAATQRTPQAADHASHRARARCTRPERRGGHRHRSTRSPGSIARQTCRTKRTSSQRHRACTHRHSVALAATRNRS